MPKKNSDFLNIFFKKLAIILSKYFNINKHIINLELNLQLFYTVIYSLALTKLGTFKTYIKFKLINNFI